MKKQYIIPGTEIMNIELPKMLASSDPPFGGGGSGIVDGRLFDAEFDELLDLYQPENL